MSKENPDRQIPMIDFGCCDALKDFLVYLEMASGGSTVANIQELKGLARRIPVCRKAGTTGGWGG